MQIKIVSKVKKLMTQPADFNKTPKRNHTSQVAFGKGRKMSNT